MGSVRVRKRTDLINPKTGKPRPSPWGVYWREPDGRERKKFFRRKVDAQAYADELTGKRVRGEYVTPAAGKVPGAEWAETWYATTTRLKPSTRVRYRGILDGYVIPAWGRHPLVEIRHADVAAWVAGLTAEHGLAPGSVRQVHRVLHLMLGLAVRDHRLARNPAAGVPLPRPRRAEPVFLTREQVADLVEAGGGLVVLVLAYTGLRFGELVALRVCDVDTLRRRITVHRSASEVAGELIESDTTKTHAARTVTLPRFLVEELAKHLGGREAGEYAFTAPGGGPLRLNNWRRRVFTPACTRCGLTGVTPHDLRHTAASLAVSAGANVKGVQRMLGHASAAMTLDVYAGLFDADLEAVADRLDALAPQVRPTAQIVDLDQVAAAV